MVQLPIIDNLMYNVQRQGKLAFYVRRLVSLIYCTTTAHYCLTDDTCRHSTFNGRARCLMPAQYGEEATLIGSAAAIANDDEWVLRCLELCTH